MRAGATKFVSASYTDLFKSGRALINFEPRWVELYRCLSLIGSIFEIFGPGHVELCRKIRVQIWLGLGFISLGLKSLSCEY